MRMPRIPQYEAAGYVEGFEAEAYDLFSRCFSGRKFNKDRWEWQFIKNPCGTKKITTLWDKNILVAMTALTPAYAYVEGLRTVCAVSGTTMARDDYRGVSIQLVQESANQNQDISFKYSFPNRQAFRIATQFYGHHYVGDIAFWMREPEKLVTDGHISRFDKFTDAHEGLYKELIKSHSFIKERSALYLNWRFTEKPRSGYEFYQYSDDLTSGYIVINEYQENHERYLQVIDIIAPDKKIFVNLIIFAINQAFERSDTYIKLWMTSEQFSSELEKLGFEYGKQPFRMTVWDRDIDLKTAYITMSDSDVF